MRPIKLVIKGLNSFNEEQTIDFNKLTEKGLFGIFGPTGSGKSTILDGLTIALYGKTSRDSSNFINTKCEEMNVSYEFQIREKIVKHYIVDRTFKRNKDGRINAKKPTRIIEVVNGEQKVIEEATTAVDKKCVEIIGLKFEDFIRTVVLPQGKFSEFLKLEGKPRREMLERLFSLAKYGDDLSRKLGAAIKKERSEMDRLTGQLKGYEEINEESYENKKEDLRLRKVQVSSEEKEYKHIFDKYADSEKLWILNQELKNHRKSEEELKIQNERIGGYKLQVVKGENSLKVKPYIDALESTLKEIKLTEQCLLKDNELLNRKAIDKNLISASYEKIKVKRDSDIPKLKIEENKVNQAMDEEKLKEKLSLELLDLRREYKVISINKEEEDSEIIKLDEIIINLDKSIILNEQKLEGKQIEELYRNQVQQGLIIQEKLELSRKRKNSLSKDIKEISGKIENLKKSVTTIGILIAEKKASLLLKDDELKEISNNCPGDAITLLEMQSNISNLKVIVEYGNNYKKELEQLTNEILKLSRLINNDKPIQVQLIKEVEGLKNATEGIKRENLAIIMREGLAEGIECPICGAKQHALIKHTIHHETINNPLLEEKEKLLLLKETKLNNINNELITYEVKRTSNVDKRNLVEDELKKLREDWITIDIEALSNDFISMKVAIEKSNSLKQRLEKNIKISNEELNIYKVNYGRDESSLNENKRAFDKYTEELQKLIEESNIQIEKCISLKNNIGTDNFLKKNEEIKQIDKERVNLDRAIKVERSDAKSKIERNEIHKKILNNLVDKLATLRTQGEDKSKQVFEKEKSIKNKVGEELNLAIYKKEILKNIEKTEIEFINIEKEKKVIEEIFNEYEGNAKAHKLQLISSEFRIKNENLKLQSAIITEGFKDKAEVLKFIIPVATINELRETITQYGNSVNQLKGIIQELVKKIDGKKITSDEWLEIQQLKIHTEQELKELTDNVIKVRTELEEIKKKFLELKDLRTEKEKLAHKLSLLNDLDGLFKGKRFVEFVAIYQLKYVSLEASKRLKEITCGAYGLEVDEEGKFIIRDYKNGGATRDASTLSGGETFLASLSLALALSAQIQLKGTAPLELFFLDEGFGTLDDDLLEVVMDSLERIHSDKLSVGIISHIESIKNRVPIKLIIEPAEAGVSGSKSRIEIS